MDNSSEQNSGVRLNEIKLNISGHICIFDSSNFEKFQQESLCVLNKSPAEKLIVFCNLGPLYMKRYSRIITKAPSDLLVDHKNGNTLDNHIDNLRIVTRQQNAFNRIGKRGRDLPKGVTRHGSGFRAQICRNYINRILGQFNTVEEAEAAYIFEATKLFGEYALHKSRG